MEEMNIEPIGVVRREGGGEGAARDEVVRLEVSDEYAPGLHRIEEAEKIMVLFWLDRLEPERRRAMRCHPYGDKSLEERGVFALRAPMRPNPIGMTRVKLVRREGNTLHVRGLDALDGSPLVDIKSSGAIPGTGRD